MRGRITSKNVGQAREGEERGKGIPLEDIERACRHYRIKPRKPIPSGVG